MAYDPTCVEFFKISYIEYVLRDARSSPIATRAHVADGQADVPVATRGRESIPRRIYTRPADYVHRGYTQGCRGCAWVETQIGPRVLHSEECRLRIETAIGADGNDN